MNRKLNSIQVLIRNYRRTIDAKRHEENKALLALPLPEFIDQIDARQASRSRFNKLFLVGFVSFGTITEIALVVLLK